MKSLTKLIESVTDQKCSQFIEAMNAFMTEQEMKAPRLRHTMDQFRLIQENKKKQYERVL